MLNLRTTQFLYLYSFYNSLLYATMALLCEVSREVLLIGLFCPSIWLIYTTDNLIICSAMVAISKDCRQDNTTNDFGCDDLVLFCCCCF